ncbi:CCA tRNA nucleotidyltransferase [Azospirillum melinis]|uniref:CCA tRNA nucleotidyltransferase n=1 Tax=Azospirillum melinis TaxID=328839 RepID=A0ABX2K4Q7_9PROT|nr:CCA tRNA nucleotidyltransferase [Azospirillum melinis]MBP2304197.1 poly(A) polymerase [Azospirillum melinis]NUA98559.1 CCA tRNA nucleotidyltransferase [Azospirillum melinis]
MTVAARLSPQPWMTAPESLAVFDALASGGADARFVGGCVRDAWLGRPVKDIDIATHAPPERVMELLEAAGIRAIPTGITHGTVTALCGGKPYEITTLRRDVETFGRHARVEFTDDWIEDAARRDLTMNAMSCTPDGAMFDPFGGLADLAAGRVRFVGEARRRIEEDVLRLLRFFRFHAHYGRGEPDAEAMAACRELAPRLPTLSGERVRGELFRLLTAACAASVWRLMMGQGIMVHLLPEAMDTDRLERLIAVERDLGVTPDPTRRLAAVLDSDRPGALRAADALRLSNHERERLLALVEPPVAVSPADNRKALRQALYRVGDAELFGDLLLIAAAIHDGPLDLGALRKALSVADDLPGLKLPIAGRDLLELGVPRGPLVGGTLKRVEAWWIAEDFQPDRDACLEMARGFLDQASGLSA